MSPEYHGPAAQLLQIGKPDIKAWPDYPGCYGLTREDVPELVRMASDESGDELDSEDPQSWAPVHAWRALGQLGAVEAAAPLVRLLSRVDILEDEWAAEELPEVLGMLGPEAIPHVIFFLADPAGGTGGKGAAAAALKQIATRAPEVRLTCVAALMGVLDLAELNDPAVNGFVVSELIHMRAVEALQAIREAYERKLVDEDICGDIQEVEIALGVRTQREGGPWRSSLAEKFAPMVQALEAVRAARARR